MSLDWICCQIGAREHYAIPRSLYASNQLHALITDTWITPQSPLKHLPKTLFHSLQERYHPDLATAPVQCFNLLTLTWELRQRLLRNLGWSRILDRNTWFQKQTLKILQNPCLRPPSQHHHPVLFCYSYAALEILRFAKTRNWFTVLGQIDPGIEEDKIVRQEYQRYAHLAPHYHSPPPQYWHQWQQECELADCIIVNSSWSLKALQSVGIPTSKLKVVPLAYTPPPEAQTFARTYPEAFSHDRPLRLLFLGQVILRKGIAAIIEAAGVLIDRPVEFWIVGNLGIVPPISVNVRWFGAVPRSHVSRYYQAADVFLFPTLSDGFGLTQLEAQAWKLPIIASQFCANVVTNQENGILLDSVSKESLSEAILFCLNNPARLQQFSQKSCSIDTFNLPQLQASLQRMTDAII